MSRDIKVRLSYLVLVWNPGAGKIEETISFGDVAVMIRHNLNFWKLSESYEVIYHAKHRQQSVEGKNEDSKISKKQVDDFSSFPVFIHYYL